MYRQGELLIKKVKGVSGNKLSHLVIAEGEVTTHKHEITSGKAELYAHEGTLFLRCMEESVLTHPDHKEVMLPAGDYEITIQREYVVGDEKYRKVVD